MVLAIAIAFIVVTSGQAEETFWNELLTNLGYGILPSALFAALVDYGNKNRENEWKAEVRKVLKAELRLEFFKLRESVQNVVENRYGSSDEKYTFLEWVNKAFCKESDMTEDDYWNETLEINVCVSFICKAATALLERVYVVMDYLDDPKELIARVRHIRAVASCIETAFQEENFNHLAQQIGERLINGFLKIAPEHEKDFLQPYNYRLEEENQACISETSCRKVIKYRKRCLH